MTRLILSWSAQVLHFPKIQVSAIKLPKIFWGVFLFAFVLSGSFFGFQVAYAERVYPRVKVAGIDVGGKSQDELKALFGQKAKELGAKEISVSYLDQNSVYKLGDLGIGLNVQTQTNEAFSVGRDINWLDSQKELILSIFKGKNLPLVLSFDEPKLDEFLTQLDAQLQKPQNAGLAIQGATVSIIPSKEGYTLQKEDFKNKLKDNLLELNLNPIELALAKGEPGIKEEGATKAKQEAENIMAAPLIFAYENKTYPADSAQIGKFIAFKEKDSELTVVFSDGAIDNYIASIAKKIDIKPVDTEILSTNQQVLKEGSDGRAVDRGWVKSQIKEALQGGSKNIALKVDARPHGQKTINPAGTPGLFKGKYIEIVLSKQTLYAFDGQTLVRSFLISSGKSPYATPTGTFSVYSKSRSSLMTGPGYYLPNVEWVNRFTGSYSIHGTYWHSNFGHPMSHGCVNATNADAQFIYEWAPIGTPVYVHR